MPDPATPRVAIATYRALPDLDDDGQRLLAGLRSRGLRAQATVWDDPAIRWSDFDVVVLRSVWDYHHRWAEFARWLARLPTMINSRAVVAWNADKQYLGELDRAGIPVVPTTYVIPGAGTVLDLDDDVLDLEASLLDADLVVKPAIGASAHDAFRCGSAATAEAAIGHITGSGRTALVQPYLPAVDTVGEMSLVFLGGEFSHAFRRAPRLALDDAQTLPNNSEPATASTGELELARRALRAAPAAVTYARVDLLTDTEGDPVVSELELIEPGLRLDLAPPAALDRLVDGIERQVREVADR